MKLQNNWMSIVDIQQFTAIHYLGELVEYGFFNDILDAFEQFDEIQVYSDCYSYKDYAEQLVDDLVYLSGVPDLIKWNVDMETLK